MTMEIRVKFICAFLRQKDTGGINFTQPSIDALNGLNSADTAPQVFVVHQPKRKGFLPAALSLLY